MVEWMCVMNLCWMWFGKCEMWVQIGAYVIESCEFGMGGCKFRLECMCWSLIVWIFKMADYKS